jgi:hypothetical protein
MNHIETELDKSRALDILEKAFKDVPGVIWMIRNREKSKEHLRILLSVCLEEAIHKQGAYLTKDRNGIILFYRLQIKPKSITIFFKKLYLFIKVFGIIHGIRVLRSRKLIDAIRPKAGWYGWFIATDKEAAKGASALEIKNEVFRMSSTTNEPVYAETTVHRIVNIYERIGFKVYAKMKHPYSNIDIWFLRRDPRPILL